MCHICVYRRFASASVDFGTKFRDFVSNKMAVVMGMQLLNDIPDHLPIFLV